jgi:hypothetical protein
MTTDRNLDEPTPAAPHGELVHRADPDRLQRMMDEWYRPWPRFWLLSAVAGRR